MALKEHIRRFIEQIPKAELHVHLEGTIEPELMLKIASRNGIKLGYDSIESIRKAYRFNNLREFLILYNEGTKILRQAEDFYDITLAYLQKVVTQNVLHTEIFIDFQTYSRRGIQPGIMMSGINRAIDEAKERWGISVELIMCFLRHLGPEAASRTLRQLIRFKEQIIGIGIASKEIGFPPELFEKVYEEARKHGFLTVAHAGEEGPWQYVRNSIDILKVDRIDHGNRACENEELTQQIIALQIPLTICPLSNIRLKNVDKMENHTVKKMLHKNMLVTINSDDPSYFGGYINENFIAAAESLDLSMDDIYQLALNSFKASFISKEKKKAYIEKLESFNSNFS